MKATLVVGLLAFVACSSSRTPVDHASFGSLDLNIPSGWTTTARANTASWSPANNTGKETLSLTRTRPLPALAKAGQAAIERLLVEAQKTLPQSSELGVPSRFTTPSGMVGVKVEEDFRPEGQVQTYRRIHAVVIDGDAEGTLVHVVYTAATPDKEPMQIVLDSLRRKDG